MPHDCGPHLCRLLITATLFVIGGLPLFFATGSVQLHRKICSLCEQIQSACSVRKCIDHRGRCQFAISYILMPTLQQTYNDTEVSVSVIRNPTAGYRLLLSHVHFNTNYSVMCWLFNYAISVSDVAPIFKSGS